MGKMNQQEAGAVNTLWSVLACQPRTTRPEPPTKADFDEALKILAEPAAAAFQDAGVTPERMAAVTDKVSLDLVYDFVSPNDDCPEWQYPTLAEAVQAADSSGVTDAQFVRAHVIVSAMAPVAQQQVDEARAELAAAPASDPWDTDGWKTAREATFAQAPAGPEINPDTRLPVGVDVDEFRQQIAACVQYANAATAVVMVLDNAKDLRDNVIPQHRDAGDTEQVRVLSAQVERMVADPLGYFYGRGQQGQLRLPLSGGWPFDDAPWEPDNDPLVNLDKAIARLQRMRSELVLSPAVPKDGDDDA